jgi:hypothetical protein
MNETKNINMKHIKTFEGYVESLSEGLSPAKMKEVIAAAAESLAGQLDDEGMEASEVEDFLEENPNAAESTLEGMEEEYGVDLVSLWPKMKADVIKKVQEILGESSEIENGDDVNESALAIAGGIILGALGLNLIAKIFKGVSAGISLMRVTDPGKMKEIASQISTEAITNKGINPLKAVLWQQTVEGMIDKGEIKNAYELAKTIKGIDDIDIKKVFEGENNDEVNEGINTKAKQLQAKFEDAILVSDFQAGWDDDDEEAERVNNIMKKLGTTPETTLFASDANDEDGYEDFIELVYKSGLKYEEVETPDYVQEIYVAAK